MRPSAMKPSLVAPSLRRVVVAAAAIVALLIAVADAELFSVKSLLTDFTLSSGRPSACPSKLSYNKLASSNQLIPAASMSANDAVCKGPGGKRVEDGTNILPLGLPLPSHVSHSDVFFFAGVETAPRVCGPWAFNASSISWFFVNSRQVPIEDEQLAMLIKPRHLYLTYSHFSDFCVFEKKLDQPFEYSSKQQEAQQDAHKEKEKNEQPPPTTQEPVCFPSDAVVLSEDGRRVRMNHLAIGDRVLTSSNRSYSDIFLFTHQDHSVVAPFVQISTASKEHIVLSASHYLYLNNRIQAADTAKIGDFVTLESGANDLVVNVESVLARGLFHPQTIDGNIVVNGIMATTWTRAASPATASSLLAPIRAIYRLLPSSLFSIIRLAVETSVDCIRPLCTLVNSQAI